MLCWGNWGLTHGLSILLVGKLDGSLLQVVQQVLLIHFGHDTYPIYPTTFDILRTKNVGADVYWCLETHQTETFNAETGVFQCFWPDWYKQNAIEQEKRHVYSPWFTNITTYTRVAASSLSCLRTEMSIVQPFSSTKFHPNFHPTCPDLSTFQASLCFYASLPFRPGLALKHFRTFWRRAQGCRATTWASESWALRRAEIPRSLVFII